MHKLLIALRLAHAVLPVCLVKQLKCLCKIFTKFATKFHTHTHTHCFSSSFIVTLSLIRRTACALAEFSGCSSTTNAHSEMGQMAFCCQNLPLGVLISHSVPFLLVGALFKKFGLFLNMPSINNRSWITCSVIRISTAQFEVLSGLLLKTRGLWNGTLSNWVGSSYTLKVHSAVFFGVG